ncbi:MAG: hypothetical protein IPK59_23225 [Rhodospirillaceae bacterium]|nr:hypothetical protein [Rhodospirillaceae bacterium]
MNPRPRILATQHVAVVDGIRLTAVVLDKPPVAVVSDIESIMGGWWYRSGSYPVGRIFGTLLNP